jgi:hypothetical protein
MAEKKLLSKRNLYLVQVGEPKPYGTNGKSLLPFNAKDLSLEHGGPLVDKSLRFVAFQEPLQQFVKALKANDIFQVDYEEVERPGSEYGPDRTVVQIYKADGKPVLVQGQQKGGGFPGRSPESIRLEYSFKAQIESAERVSIEGQTAIAQVGTWLLNPEALTKTLSQDQVDRIVKKYWAAVEKALDAFLAAKPLVLAQPTTAAVPGNAPGKAQEGQGKAVQAEKVSTPPPPTWPALKNVGELLTRAAKYNVQRSDALAIIGVQDVKEIKNLELAWSKLATEKKLTFDAADPEGIFNK